MLPAKAQASLIQRIVRNVVVQALFAIAEGIHRRFYPQHIFGFIVPPDTPLIYITVEDGCPETIAMRNDKEGVTPSSQQLVIYFDVLAKGNNRGLVGPRTP